ncbi:MAG TPA: hypothetical protein VGG74_24950 [Kofleriaceae bacterium]
MVPALVPAPLVVLAPLVVPAQRVVAERPPVLPQAATATTTSTPRAGQ